MPANFIVKGRRTMSAKQIADKCNDIHETYATGRPYTEDMFNGGPNDRLNGVLCDCPHGGKFFFLSPDNDMVKEGNKPYIECIRCGAVSHC